MKVACCLPWLRTWHCNRAARTCAGAAPLPGPPQVLKDGQNGWNKGDRDIEMDA